LAFALYLVVAATSYNDIGRGFYYVVGHLTAWHLALTILPISRTAPWILIFGISFERALKWHRWIARVAVVLSTVHGSQMFVLKGLATIGGTIPTTEGAGDLWGALAWLCIITIFVTAYEPIRRRAFEFFYYTHYLFILAIIFACLHSRTAWYLCAGGIVIWFIDRGIRFGRSRQRVKVVRAKVLRGSETVTNLELQIDGFRYGGGDYAFINVPSISLTQWHPFSISSAPNWEGDPFSFHIMDMGNNQWTSKLAAIAQDLNDGKRSIYVDGPYGSLSIAMEDYSHVILCCGGVGATPMMSLLGELFVRFSQGGLRHIENVHLVWACSNETPIRTWFPKLLGQINKVGKPVFHLHLYATGAKKPNKAEGGTELKERKAGDTEEGALTGEELTIATGSRPKYDALFKEVLESSKNTPAKVAVLACGPAPMVQAVQTEALRREFHLHKETFFF